MKVSIFGINHKTAPTAIREKLVFDQDLISQALESFKQELNSEVVILSTCNRTEIYSSKTESELIEKWLSKYHQVAISHVKKYSYFKKKQRCFSARTKCSFRIRQHDCWRASNFWTNQTGI